MRPLFLSPRCVPSAWPCTSTTRPASRDTVHAQRGHMQQLESLRIVRPSILYPGQYNRQSWRCKRKFEKIQVVECRDLPAWSAEGLCGLSYIYITTKEHTISLRTKSVLLPHVAAPDARCIIGSRTWVCCLLVFSAGRLWHKALRALLCR